MSWSGMAGSFSMVKGLLELRAGNPGFFGLRCTGYTNWRSTLSRKRFVSLPDVLRAGSLTAGQGSECAQASTGASPLEIR